MVNLGQNSDRVKQSSLASARINFTQPPTNHYSLPYTTIHHRSLEDYLPISNPYNSSMYRMAASHKDAPRRLFLQKFVSNEIIPPYVIDGAEVNEELQNIQNSGHLQLLVYFSLISDQ